MYGSGWTYDRIHKYITQSVNVDDQAAFLNELNKFSKNPTPEQRKAYYAEYMGWGKDTFAKPPSNAGKIALAAGAIGIAAYVALS